MKQKFGRVVVKPVPAMSGAGGLCRRDTQPPNRLAAGAYPAIDANRLSSPASVLVDRLGLSIGEDEPTRGFGKSLARGLLASRLRDFECSTITCHFESSCLYVGRLPGQFNITLPNERLRQAIPTQFNRRQKSPGDRQGFLLLHLQSRLVLSHTAQKQDRLLGHRSSS